MGGYCRWVLVSVFVNHQLSIRQLSNNPVSVGLVQGLVGVCGVTGVCWVW